MAGLEITLLGAQLRFLADTVVAITGADLGPHLDGQPLPTWQPIAVAEGGVLSFAEARDGMRAYLALAGGIADAVIIHSGLTTEVLADTIARIREGERAAGRPEASAEVWAFAKCNIADRRQDAIDEIKMALVASGHHAFRFTLEGKNVPEELQESVMALQGEYVPSEHEQLGDTRNAALSDELGLTDFLADRFAVAGTAGECLAKVRTIQDAGVDNLLILAISSRPDNIIRRFGEEVIARL